MNPPFVVCLSQSHLAKSSLSKDYIYPASLKVPTEQKTYAPWDSAPGIPPNDPSKFLHDRTYYAALATSTNSILLIKVIQDRAQ